MSTKQPWAGVLLLLCWPGGLVWAQSDTTLARELQEASRIRVQFVDGSRVEGSFEGLTPTHLAFRATIRPTAQRAYFADITVPRDSLGRLWVRDGSHWKMGAAAGGAALGVFGLLAGLKYAPSCGGAGCVVGGTLAMGAIGALSGGLLGALVIRWRLVWPP